MWIDRAAKYPYLLSFALLECLVIATQLQVIQFIFLVFEDWILSWTFLMTSSFLLAFLGRFSWSKNLLNRVGRPYFKPMAFAGGFLLPGGLPATFPSLFLSLPTLYLISLAKDRGVSKASTGHYWPFHLLPFPLISLPLSFSLASFCWRSESNARTILAVCQYGLVHLESLGSALFGKPWTICCYYCIYTAIFSYPFMLCL